MLALIGTHANAMPRYDLPPPTTYHPPPPAARRPPTAHGRPPPLISQTQTSLITAGSFVGDITSSFSWLAYYLRQFRGPNLTVDLYGAFGPKCGLRKMSPADSKQFAFDTCIPMEERLRFGSAIGGLDAMRKQVQGKYDKFHHAGAGGGARDRRAGPASASGVVTSLSPLPPSLRGREHGAVHPTPGRQHAVR